MVFFNWATMQMAAKIVYYGPGLCGKTTNLSYIYAKTSPNSRGEMVSLETESDRTLFFDLLPIEVGTIGGFRTRLQLYTVPGQVFYNTTRKLVLKGVDGVVFVADSQRPMREANIESFANLRENLAELGVSLDDLPLVLQYNKRDLKHILTLEELTGDLNSNGLYPSAESSAILGTGVFETLKEITKLTLRKLRSRMATPESAPQPRVTAAPVIPRVPAEAGATISAASLARAAEEGVEESVQDEPLAVEASVEISEPGGPSEETSDEEHEAAERDAAAEIPVDETDEPAPLETGADDWDGPLPDDVTQRNPVLFAEEEPALDLEAEAAAEPEVVAVEEPQLDDEPEELSGEDMLAPEEVPAEVVAPAEEAVEASAAAASSEPTGPFEEAAPDEIPEEPAPAEVEAESDSEMPAALEAPEALALEEAFPIDGEAVAVEEAVPVETAAPALEEAPVEEPTPPAELPQEEEAPAASAPSPDEKDEAAGDIEVDFGQQEELAELSPPPIKRVQVSSQMDILAELDNLRKQATNGSFAPAPQSAQNMDLDSLLSGEPDARKELRHAIAKSLNSGIFMKMRTMQLAIRIQDSDGETIQTLDPIAMDVDDASGLSHLSLKFTLDLENNG